LGNTNQPTQTTSHDSEEVTLHLESIPNPSTGEQDSTAATGMVQGAVATDGPECELCLPPTGQANICMDQGAVTKADPGHDINQPPTGPDLTAGMSMDLGAGTEDGPELHFSPPPTGKDSIAAIDQGAGTMANAEEVFNPPPTGPGTTRNQRKKVGIKPKDCPHNNQDVHTYRGIIRTRQRKGKTELLYDWMPCDLCGKTWPPTWETA
ncbi:hypothetical protein UPYG_G00236790, partial [Umbra pygmaea]